MGTSNENSSKKRWRPQFLVVFSLVAVASLYGMKTQLAGQAVGGDEPAVGCGGEIPPLDLASGGKSEGALADPNAMKNSRDVAKVNRGAIVNPSAKTLKVMSYNIKAGGPGELDQVIDLINAEDPDFVCMQEVDNNAIRSGLETQAALIAEGTDLDHFIYKATGTYEEISAPPYVDDYPGIPALYLESHGEDGERGIAVLSRHPIVFSKATDFAGNYHPRAVIRTGLDTPYGRVVFFCAHFPAGSDGDDERQAVADFLVSRAPRAKKAFIAGDFNAQTTDAEIDTLEAVWENPAADSPIGTHKVSGNQIDYVMSHNVDATSSVFEVITSPAQPSDHHPYQVTYTLR